MVERLSDVEIAEMFDHFERRIEWFDRTLSRLRDDYEQFAEKVRPPAAEISDQGRREPDAATDGGLGAAGARSAADAAAGGADRGGEEAARGDRAEEGKVTLDWEDHLLSNSLTPLYGKEAVRREYAAMLRTLADGIERGTTVMPSLIIAGLPFHPTIDTLKIEVYTFTSHSQYEKMAKYIWRKWGQDGEND